LLEAPVVVADRAGCDIAPVDIRDDAQLRRLESFVWPDQLERLAMLRAAAAVARRDPARLETSAAALWLERELARRQPSKATVIFHSIFWWYLGTEERERVQSLIEAAGHSATADAPLAWLRMEILSREGAEIRLQLWPPGDDVLLGVADPHGQQVHWNGN
jgi:hypothetical protein